MTKKTDPKQSEATYTRAELMAGAHRFGVKPEVVAGALKMAGKNEMTLSEAETAIEKFKQKKFSEKKIGGR